MLRQVHVGDWQGEATVVLRSRLHSVFPPCQERLPRPPKLRVKSTQTDAVYVSQATVTERLFARIRTPKNSVSSCA